MRLLDLNAGEEEGADGNQSKPTVTENFVGTFTLPPVKDPFLPPRDPADPELTLVLDLDETLIHFVEMGAESYFLERPGAHEFLEKMYPYYEIVIFTAGMQDVSVFEIAAREVDFNDIFSVCARSTLIGYSISSI